METNILEERVSFMRFMNTALEAMDNRILNRIDEPGRMRPGGAIDINNLGHRVWMEQFR